MHPLHDRTEPGGDQPATGGPVGWHGASGSPRVHDKVICICLSLSLSLYIYIYIYIYYH